ncbi:hypothetical protein [Sphingopyxis sp. H050]|jgi:hypothetical protein|uniref:hypothetical protein n=1 Tax=Sphingopyxis sp. H050 TaxID=1759072 RepID=UPI000B223529|nr:hypothetical protein [Sphingopyxis sp. H050]
MGKRILGMAMALALIAPGYAANAAPKSPKLAKCDGNQRRPANPYGSILPSVDPLAGTSTPAAPAQGQEQGRGGVEVFPKKDPAAPKREEPNGRPENRVPPISSLSAQISNPSC